MPTKNQNRWGQRFTGTLFGKKAIRDALVEMLNCFYGMTYRVKTRGTDGVSTITTPGTVTLGPLGGVVELDLTNVAAGGGGGSGSRYRFKDDLGSSLRCRSWDGTTEGTVDIFIAKQPTLRSNYVAAVQNGVTYSFSYSAGGADTNGNHYLSRTTAGSDGSNVTSDIEPPFIFNDSIYAVSIPAETLDGNSCTLLDLSPRAWAARQT